MEQIILYSIVSVNLIISIFIFICLYLVLYKRQKKDKEYYELIGKIKKEKNRLIEKNHELENKLNELENPELLRDSERFDIDIFELLILDSLSKAYELIFYIAKQIEEIRNKYGNKRLPEELEELLKDIYNIVRKIL